MFFKIYLCNCIILNDYVNSQHIYEGLTVLGLYTEDMI